MRIYNRWQTKKMGKKLISIKQLTNDPIPSGLVVALVTYITGQIGTFIYNFFTNNFSIEQAFTLSTSYLNYTVKVKWIIVAILALILIFFTLRIYYKTKSKNPFRYTDTKTKIGEYKAGELCNILLTIDLEIPVRLQVSGVRKLNLVKLFMLYQPNFNMGVSGDLGGEDNTFLYYKLGPQLMSYGLIEKKTRKKQFGLNENEEEEIIQTSELGYKFTSIIEKGRLYVDVYSGK